MRANLRQIAEASGRDPKKALLDAAGNVGDYLVLHNLLLVATYIPPEKTHGGIILPDNSLLENRYQGKVGLVLKKGPLAFKDDKSVNFGGVEIEEGDWVVYNPSDGTELFIRDRTREQNEGISCRLIDDINIKARVSDPALIY